MISEIFTFKSLNPILFLIGALIEYALILFKKQKVKKHSFIPQSESGQGMSLNTYGVVPDSQPLKPVRNSPNSCKFYMNFKDQIWNLIQKTGWNCKHSSSTQAIRILKEYKPSWNNSGYFD